MQTRNLSNQEQVIVNQQIGNQREIQLIHETLLILSDELIKTLNISISPLHRGQYTLNQAINWAIKGLPVSNPPEPGNPPDIQICEALSIQNPATQIKFVYNYSPFYIDLLISYRTVNNQELPVGIVVIGTFISAGKIKMNYKNVEQKTEKKELKKEKEEIKEIKEIKEKEEEFDMIKKPLTQYEVNHNASTISANPAGPTRIWTFEHIDGFLWTALAENWKDANTWNNRNFIP